MRWLRESTAVFQCPRDERPPGNYADKDYGPEYEQGSRWRHEAKYSDFLIQIRCDGTSAVPVLVGAVPHHVLQSMQEPDEPIRSPRNSD